MGQEVIIYLFECLVFLFLLWRVRLPGGVDGSAWKLHLTFSQCKIISLNNKMLRVKALLQKLFQQCKLRQFTKDKSKDHFQKWFESKLLKTSNKQHFVFEYLTLNNPSIKSSNLYCKTIQQLLIDFLENKPEISNNPKVSLVKLSMRK